MLYLVLLGVIFLPAAKVILRLRHRGIIFSVPDMGNNSMVKARYALVSRKH